MVRDTDDDACDEPAVKPAATTSALFRRAEQLKRWEESETNRVVPLAKPIQQRVRFPEKCVFLAACSSGDIEEVAHLLDRGADVNATNVDGMTGLHQAVIVENLEMVRFLLDRGAYIDAQDNEGWSPLMAGVSCNLVDIVRCLLEHGADPVLCNSDGELPIDLAEEDEMRDLLQQEICSRGLSVDEARAREEKLMLEESISWAKSPRIIKEHRHPLTGATPTHVAAAKGYCKVLRILLQAGSDVNSKDNDGWTPLHAAAHWGEKEACELLIDHHAQMDIQNNMGLTCVDVAEPDLVNFLEKSKEKRKLLTASPVSALNVQPSRRVVMCQQQQPVKQASSPPSTASVEPVTTPVLSPTGVQLPAWRLTGRRATSTSTSAASVTSPPPANMAVAAFNDAKNRSDTTPTAMTANTVVGDGASPAKRRAATDAVVVHTSDDHSRLSSSGNGQRGDESEAERKLRARRERESRRSTQGITLETIKAAENVTITSDRKKRSAPDVNDVVPKDSAATVKTAAIDSPNTKTPLTRPAAAAPSNVAPSAASLARLSANLNSTLRNFDEFIATPANTSRVAATGAADKDKFVAKFIPPLAAVGIVTPTVKTTAPAADNKPESQGAQARVRDTQASVSGVSSQVPTSTKSTTLTAAPGAALSSIAAAAPLSSGSANRARRARAGRRSTGPIAQDDVHLAAGDSSSPVAPVSDGSGGDLSAPDKENDSSRRTALAKTVEPSLNATSKDTTQSRYTSKPVFAYANLSDYRNNRSAAYLSSVTNNSSNSASCHNGPASDRFSSRTSSGVSVSSSSGGQDTDIDYKKLYEKEASENERLRKIIADLEKSMENVKFTSSKQASGDVSYVTPYNSRLEKLVAELEEENGTLEQIRADNIRLKEENGALIRVISKLSKSK